MACSRFIWILQVEETLKKTCIYLCRGLEDLDNQYRRHGVEICGVSQNAFLRRVYGKYEKEYVSEGYLVTSRAKENILPACLISNLIPKDYMPNACPFIHNNSWF